MSDLNTSYIWHGREDLEDGTKGLRWHQVIKKTNQHFVGTSACTLVGFECDTGVAANKGRTGASQGPMAIRDALSNMAWHGSASNIGLLDRGDVITTSTLEHAQQSFANQIEASLATSELVIGIGGGHEIAWGSFLGLEQHLRKKLPLGKPAKKIGIVNFDAHFDLRVPSPSASSGTPFRQIAEHCISTGQTFDYACIGVAQPYNTRALFEYAKQLNVRYLLDIDCTVEAAKELLKPMLLNVDELYVTICLDAFPASIAPGVSAPSSLGISPQFVIQLIRWLVDSQQSLHYHWQLADIAEMNPKFDIGNITGKLAARLIFEILACHLKAAQEIVNITPAPL
ncbi:MAG: formiminoglutamase [Patiriisocius sp.]|jgi:formiminoglutamase